MTNTNWQAYGEASLSYFSQMVGLTTQNFVSVATGAAVAVGMFRGIARQHTPHLGNFWLFGTTASQIAIKQLVSNGGGFFGINSAHPFENPSALSNLVEMITLDPGRRHALYFGSLFEEHGPQPRYRCCHDHHACLGLFVSITQEMKLDPALTHLASEAGNWEGKESNFVFSPA